MPDTPSDCSSTYDVGVYRSEIQQACLDIATSQPGRHIAPAGSGFCGDVWIAVARNLASFVIAIDYVGWTTQEQEEIWESYLASVVDVRLQDGMEGGQCPANGRTLREVGQQESNNIGCMARASLAAVFRHLYSNNQTHYQDLDNVRLWFRGWVGDRSSLVYTDFAENPSGSYTDTWHAGSGENRVPLLPAGTQFSHSGCTYDQLSGALPEELRRAELCDPMETGCDPMEDCDPGLPGTQCNVSAWPSVTCLNNGGHIKEDVHVYGALSGAFVTAELFRNYENNSLFNDVYTWEMNALRRAAEFVELERTTGPGPYRWDGFNGADNNGDDWWIPWIIKHLYPTVGAPIIHGTKPGKNMSFTDWTHHMGS